MQADRQARLREAARDADAGDAGQIRADRIDVGEIHRQRVVRFLADLEGGGRRGGADDHVALGEVRSKSSRISRRTFIAFR